MNRSYLPFALGYTSLIIYASLFPCSGWSTPRGEIFGWLTPELPKLISRSDLAVNLLAYIPLGFLLVTLFSIGRKRLAPLFLAILIGCGISFLMETLQMFLPTRVASLLDLVTNSTGTVLGSLAALAFRPSAAARAGLAKLRADHLLPGRRHDLALAVIAGWALSQLAPFFPSVNLGDVKNALKPLWYTIHDLSRFDAPKSAVYACTIAALGLVALAVAKDKSRPRAFFSFMVFAGGVLCSKIFFYGRQLSLEALAGLMLGAVLVGVLFRLRRPWHCWVGSALIIAGFVLTEISAGAPARLAPGFDWVPFRSLMNNELSGFETILAGSWPFAGLSYFYLSLYGEQRRTVAVVGGFAVFLFVFGLEWNQLSIPGRTADITQAIIAAAGWSIPWAYLSAADQGKRSNHRFPAS